MKWRRGVTLLTPKTKHWTKEQIEQSDKVEQTKIYANFFDEDQGRGRRLVCTLENHYPEYERNATLIENAPDLYEVLKDIYKNKVQETAVVNIDVLNKIDEIIKRIEISICCVCLEKLSNQEIIENSSYDYRERICNKCSDEINTERKLSNNMFL